jgi:hypothetical protein
MAGEYFILKSLGSECLVPLVVIDYIDDAHAAAQNSMDLPARTTLVGQAVSTLPVGGHYVKSLIERASPRDFKLDTDARQ